jgi:hypothetical protein
LTNNEKLLDNLKFAVNVEIFLKIPLCCSWSNFLKCVAHGNVAYQQFLKKCDIQSFCSSSNLLIFFKFKDVALAAIC